MTYRVVVTERAARDVEEITGWWSRERSPDQATRWYTGIRNAISTLDTGPDAYPLATESNEFPYELREMHYGVGKRATHRVLFTILSEAVLVLAIRHASQDRVTSRDLAD